MKSKFSNFLLGPDGWTHLEHIYVQIKIYESTSRITIVVWVNVNHTVNQDEHYLFSKLILCCAYLIHFVNEKIQNQSG